MSKNGKPDFWDWIGVQKKTDYTQLPAWVGHFIGWVFSALALTLLAIGLGIIGYLVKSLFLPGGTNPAESIRNLGLAAGAVIGVPFLIWRSVVAQKQVDVAEQGHITDRINKAVEGLGAEKTVKREGKDHTEPNLEVRIGALYALERISQDSARDHIQIMEILCAYIRQNADRNSPPLPEEDLTPEEWRAWGEANRTHPPLDVDIALRIIERRSDERKQREQETGYRLGFERAPFYSLDLNGRDLTGAILSNALLQGVDFGWAKLMDTHLSWAKLHGANLCWARLEGANASWTQFHGSSLSSANLKKTVLWETEFNNANCVWARFNEADMFNAQLLGTDFTCANLAGVSLSNVTFDAFTQLINTNLVGAACCDIDFSCTSVSQQQLETAFGDASTILSKREGPDHKDWPPHWPKDELDPQEFQTAWREWQTKIGFQPD